MEFWKLILLWAALNVFLLLVIVLIIMGWKRSRPLVGSELAKRLAKESGEDPQRPSFSLGEAAFLLRETGRAPEAPLLTAVLTGWRAAGRISCEMAPKKKLASFGEDMQPTLAFSAADTSASRHGRGREPAVSARPPGAEGALLELFESACANGSLQSSEAYNWARANAAELRNILLRFEAEGRAQLRAEGAVHDETRKGLFGAAARERLIYTPRGLRRALELRRWENHLRRWPGDSPVDSVLLSCGEPPQPLGLFCERLMQGYTAGLKSG